MGKQTLKHVVNGKTFTRQTARSYTHVVVARDNVDKQLARHAARKESDESVVRYCNEWWKHYQDVLAAGVGGKVFYMRNQGGYYLNKSGPQLVVHQGMVDLGNDLVAQHGTLDNYIATCKSNRDRNYETERTRISSSDQQWYVTSWHGNANLAHKAAAALADYLDTRVEAINNGVQS